MRALAILLLAAVVLAAAPSATAQDPVTIKVTAKESGCGAGKTYCFTIDSGSLSSVKPGTSLTIEFVNPQDNASPHEVSVTTFDKRDPEHKGTKFADAIGSTDRNIDPGGEGTVTVTVPADATGIYLWCSVAGHETLGMWTEQPFSADPDGSTTGGKSPMPTPVLGMLAALGVAFVVRRRD